MDGFASRDLPDRLNGRLPASRAVLVILILSLFLWLAIGWGATWVIGRI
jgi:hypothetical protein